MITLGTSLQERGFEVTMSANELIAGLGSLAASHGLKIAHRLSQQADPLLFLSIPTRRYKVVVLDGYDFSPRTCEELVGRGERVVIIDDNGVFSESACHLIVNQNLHADQIDYRSNRYRPIKLLGPEFALIRKEISRNSSLPVPKRSGVFVSQGGTDVLSLRDEVEALLQNFRKWPVVSAKGFSSETSTLTTDIGPILARSRVGLLALGTTIWEALHLGLPFVGTIVADNQERAATALESAGLTKSFDFRDTSEIRKSVEYVADLYDSEVRLCELSDRGKSIVDGRGADRVADFVSKL
jgi:spore coat polysaccharide biosynthesis predicted glycosyltransferase SpsG